MKKILRFILLSLTAMIVVTTYAQKTVTIDFDNDYQKLFPTLKGVSSGTGDNYVADGDFIGATTSTPVDGVTVVISPDEDAKTPSRIWGTSPRLRMYSGSFSIVSSSEPITKIEFEGHNTNFNLSAVSGSLDGKTWTGSDNVVVFQVSKNTQIKSIVVTLGNTGDNPNVNTGIIEFAAATDNAKDVEDKTMLTKDGITLKLDVGTNTSENPIGTLGRDDNYRIFKGNTMTITSTVGKITLVKFVCTANGDAKYGPGNIDCLNTGNDDVEISEDEGPNYYWYGSADELQFTAYANQVRATQIVIYIGEAGDKAFKELPFNDISYIYLALFRDEGKGQFTINDVNLGEGLTYVWKEDSQYGMKASAYNKKNIESESWLISPEIDLAGVTMAEAGFTHIINKYFGDVTKEATVWIREVGGEWKQVTITYPTIPEGKSFSEMTAEDAEVTFSLDEYLGKKIQIGFKYTSTNEHAGTWEIVDFDVVGITNGAANVTNIKAVETPAQRYNLAGQKVGAGYRGMVIMNGRKFFQQ